MYLADVKFTDKLQDVRLRWSLTRGGQGGSTVFKNFATGCENNFCKAALVPAKSPDDVTDMRRRYSALARHIGIEKESYDMTISILLKCPTRCLTIKENEL